MGTLGRLVEFKPLRGTQADLQKALPLFWGEFYFAADTGNLFMGTPGSGVGYVQIGDTAHVNETLLAILAELKAMRKAMVALVTDGGRSAPQDFEPSPDPEESLRE
jgi:hypothetical protein